MNLETENMSVVEKLNHVLYEPAKLETSETVESVLGPLDKSMTELETINETLISLQAGNSAHITVSTSVTVNPEESVTITVHPTGPDISPSLKLVTDFLTKPEEDTLDTPTVNVAEVDAVTVPTESAAVIEPVVQAEPIHVTKLTENLNKQFNKIFEKGTLVSLHISMWSMSAPLVKKDLGLASIPEIVKLGRKMLMNKEVKDIFDRIQGKARAYLNKFSKEFPISEARFVFAKDLPEVIETLTACKVEFEQKTEEFFAGYENNKLQLLASLDAEIAKPNSDPNLRNIRDEIVQGYPDVDKLRPKFKFRWYEFSIATPSTFNKQFTQAAVDANIAQAITETEQIAQKEVREKAEAQSKHLFDFVHDIGSTVRSRILESCNIMLEKRRAGDLISAKNVKKLLRTISEFREINFLEDTAVAQKLNLLEELLGDSNSAKKITDAPTLARLDVALAELVTETQNIGDLDALTGNYFRAVEVDDD